MVPELIPPQVRSRLRELRLTARRAAGRHGVGLHHSPSRGAGLEFAQYRAYEPGDELRQIDWKLYARSDRFFVREAERESPLTLWLLIDGSASMRQREPGSGQTRLQAACALAACLAQLALQQGDRFGLIGLAESGLQLVSAGTGTRQRDRLWLGLQGLQAEGGFPAAERLAPVWERVAPRDLVVLLSDFFDEQMLVLAERLAAARREVIALPLLTSEERDFPFRGGHRFDDPETGEQLAGDGGAMRADYLARFAAARQALAARLDASGIRHATHVLDEPLDLPLRRLFGAHGAAEYA